MKIKELIKCLGRINCFAADNFEVSGISCNSKQVGDDFVFVAINGASCDGNQFIAQAVDNGARVVITQQQAGRAGAGKEACFIKVKDARKALDNRNKRKKKNTASLLGR